MSLSVITGLFTLAGVFLGVVLEPLKSRFVDQTNARALRGERCAQLIRAVTSTRSLLLAINLINREREQHPDKIHSDRDEVVRQYRTARRKIRENVALLHLSGPDPLAEAADALRRADRDLRAVRHVVGDEDGDIDPDVLPDPVQRAADFIEEETIRFARTASRYV